MDVSKSESTSADTVQPSNWPVIGQDITRQNESGFTSTNDEEEPEDIKLEDTITSEESKFFDPLTSDEALVKLSVRELNKVLRNVPGDIRMRMKQRRRLLKNRGYAQKCRNRRICSQKIYCEQNEQLKNMVERMKEERDMYKMKYEHLKAIFRKAKMERERRKLLKVEDF